MIGDLRQKSLEKEAASGHERSQAVRILAWNSICGLASFALYGVTHHV